MMKPLDNQIASKNDSEQSPFDISESVDEEREGLDMQISQM